MNGTDFDLSGGMPLLDCATFESAIESIAKATSREASDISARVESFDRTATFDPMLDPRVERPKALIEWIDPRLGSEAFSGAYYFHGSRVLDPDSFVRRGIIPLPEIIDELWAQLGVLCEPEVSGAKWADFKKWFEQESTDHFADLLRMKVHESIQHGPYAEIVRPVLLDPTQSRHDYLATPEAAEDICHVAESHFGIGVFSRFQRASTPCIVKFGSDQLSSNQFEAVATYLLDSMEGNSTENVYGYIPDGKSVPPEKIVTVEMISP